MVYLIVAIVLPKLIQLLSVLHCSTFFHIASVFYSNFVSYGSLYLLQ